MVIKNSQPVNGFANNFFYAVIIAFFIHFISCKIPQALTGKQHEESAPKEILVWPPPPDTPRIQFLTAISNSQTLAHDTERKPTRLSGQVYRRIPGDVSSGMELMILNDNDSLLSVLRTDSAGNFALANLPNNSQYIFKLIDDTVPWKIRVFDENSTLSHVLEKDKKSGKFYYSSYDWQDMSMEMHTFSDSLLHAFPLFADSSKKPKRLSGQIIGHIPGEIKRNLEIYALNDSREIVGVTRVLQNGNFGFTRLPPYNNYLFIIKDENDLPVYDIDTLFIGNNSSKEIRSVGKNIDGYFRYKYLPFQDVVIYALDEQKDTLMDARLNYDGLFLFALLPMDASLSFRVAGGATMENIDEMSIIVNGRMRVIKKDEDNVFRFVKLPTETVRLFLLSPAGDTLQTALINENGFFEFKGGLPYLEKYLFLLDADNVESIDEIQVISTDDNGHEKIITPLKGKGGYFSYQKLPVSEVKLYLVNTNRDTLNVAIMDEEGYFSFKKLIPDSNYLFLLDSRDTGLFQDIDIRIENNEKIVSEITATRESGNLYQYKPLVHADLANQGLPDDSYVPVHLKKIEEKILSSASTHLEFNLGESVLQMPSYLYIEGVNRLLIKNPTWNLVLSGHTDNTGSDEFNMGLSKRRAEAVKKALVKRGIPAGRIITKYYGESIPVADNVTPEGRKKNRRVEMAIVQSAPAEAQVIQETGQDWKTSIMSAGMHDIVFTVQLMASPDPVALTPLNFNGLENVEELVDEGVYRYLAGISYDYEYASVVLLNEMRKAGFQDGIVIALQDGKKIPVEQAKNLINK